MSLVELENGQLAAEIQKVGSVNRLVKIVRSWIPAPVQHDERVASVHVDISDTCRNVFPSVEQNLKDTSDSGLVFDNRGPFIIIWTGLISLVCFYNMATITILIFEEVHTVHYTTWLIANATTDFLLFLDLAVQSRTAFYEDGVLIYNSIATRDRYISSWEFVIDIGALLPTDFLLFIKHNMSLFRSNRLLKCYRMFYFVNLADMRIQCTSAWSITKVMIIAAFIFHWNACGYYLMSTMLDIDNVGKSDWAFSFDKINDPVFPKCEMTYHLYVCRLNETEHEVDLRDDNTTDGERHRQRLINYWSPEKFNEAHFSNLAKEYVLSMYWSSMTITTLGEQPEPNFSYQNLYEIMDTIIGILLFAVIVGSVGDMVANSNAYTSDLRGQLDGVKLFMKTRQVEYLLQKKALNFFGYMLNNRHVDDRPMKRYLPGKLRQAMQMSIHEEMLREIDLFKVRDMVECAFIHLTTRTKLWKVPLLDLQVATRYNCCFPKVPGA
uniref:Cyclic nucleotide-binding domain-containing protein n=2 Tax=Steinernema glaseri TaxID=37863 RepID=A0A1I8AQB3_9BILA